MYDLSPEALLPTTTVISLSLPQFTRSKRMWLRDIVTGSQTLPLPAHLSVGEVAGSETMPTPHTRIELFF